jgi:cell division septation protein DedD
MEQKGKGAKSFSNLLSKTAGLVFFSFLAISLGVVFGLLFEGWVKDQPGTPVGTDDTLQTADLATEKNTTNTDATANNVKIVDDTASTKPLNSVTAKKPVDLATSKKPVDLATGRNPTEATIPAPTVSVKYKVRVGPYSSRNEAMAASQQLYSLGYPVYVSNKPPFAVQVGAFATPTNADHLKAELVSKGYKVIVDQN